MAGVGIERVILKAASTVGDGFTTDILTEWMSEDGRAGRKYVPGRRMVSAVLRRHGWVNERGVWRDGGA